MPGTDILPATVPEKVSLPEKASSRFKTIEDFIAVDDWVHFKKEFKHKEDKSILDIHVMSKIVEYRAVTIFHHLLYNSNIVPKTFSCSNSHIKLFVMCFNDWLEQLHVVADVFKIDKADIPNILDFKSNGFKFSSAQFNWLLHHNVDCSSIIHAPSYVADITEKYNTIVHNVTDDM